MNELILNELDAKLEKIFYKYLPALKDACNTRNDGEKGIIVIVNVTQNNGNNNINQQYVGGNATANISTADSENSNNSFSNSKDKALGEKFERKFRNKTGGGLI